MLDLIIDIETLGTGPAAAVISIGAVKYDRTSGQITDKFYAAISRADAEKYGTTTQSTLDWWAKQDMRASAAAFSGKELSVTVAERFAQFARGTKPWGNGSVFDVVIMETLFNAHGIKCPWLFWNIRDLRTLVDLAEYVAAFDKKSVPFEGIQHHALHDAVHEAHVMRAAIAALQNKSGNTDPTDLVISSY